MGAMSDTDTIRWIDAEGKAHIPLNVPEFDAPQRVIVQQIRHYFDGDARFWQRQPLSGDDLGAVDLLLRVILPAVPHSEIAQHAAREKVRFLIRWFAL
jgi:hypothetical protein